MCFNADGSNLLAFVSIFFSFFCSPLCVLQMFDYVLSYDDTNHIFFVYFSWLCCFMAQMNPLMGPRLHQGTLLIVAREWGNLPYDMKDYVPIEGPSEH